MKTVQICYTYNNKHELTIVKVLDDFKQAKEWQHDRAHKIIRMQRLYSSYILAKTNKSKDVAYTKFYRFREKNKLYDSETPSSPFFHTWEVKEKGVD